jgi:hypothetical protein
MAITVSGPLQRQFERMPAASLHEQRETVGFKSATALNKHTHFVGFALDVSTSGKLDRF